MSDLYCGPYPVDMTPAEALLELQTMRPFTPSPRSFKVDELEEAYDEATVTLTQEQVDAIWAYIRASIALQLRNQSAMAMKGIDYIEAEHIADALESGDV
jgi:hypothetical protein